MMEVGAGDHLDGERMMRGETEESLFLLRTLAVRVCRYSLSSLYRFLGNALCILLSICVDRLLLQNDRTVL